MTTGVHRHVAGVDQAAMEPAEDRLDDVNADGSSYTGEAPPQWSQPKIGWMTLHGALRVDLVSRAAMEPAEDRLDDA